MSKHPSKNILSFSFLKPNIFQPSKGRPNNRGKALPHTIEMRDVNCNDIVQAPFSSDAATTLKISVRNIVSFKSSCTFNM